MANKIEEVYYVCLEDDETVFLPGINPDGPGYHTLDRVLAIAAAQQKSMETGRQWKMIVLPRDVPPRPPSVLPPISLVTSLATNEEAAWPFPQLRATNPALPRSLESIKHITVHHSAGSRATTNVTYWHQLHTQTKSWSRCGYHLCVGGLTAGADIELYEVNPPQWLTWHDTRNTDTYAVTFAGDLRTGHDIEPNEIQLDCFGRAMAYCLPKLSELESIVPHKFWQATACPGDIERWFPLLVDAAKQYGHNIEPLLRFVPTRSKKLMQILSIGRTGPPLSDYGDV